VMNTGLLGELVDPPVLVSVLVSVWLLVVLVLYGVPLSRLSAIRSNFSSIWNLKREETMLVIGLSSYSN